MIIFKLVWLSFFVTFSPCVWVCPMTFRWYNPICWFNWLQSCIHKWLVMDDSSGAHNKPDDDYQLDCTSVCELVWTDSILFHLDLTSPGCVDVSVEAVTSCVKCSKWRTLRCLSALGCNFCFFVWVGNFKKLRFVSKLSSHTQRLLVPLN